MKESKDQILADALAGDINAFHELFSAFQPQLKSYLYRLLASRSEADDLTHDTFIRAFDKLHLYRGEASLKTWVFHIGTNLAHNILKKRKRWADDITSQAKQLVMSQPPLQQKISRINHTSPFATYDIKEHIDTCFTCVGKHLPIENQVALLLKDIYDFSVKEVMHIVDKSEGTIKYLLQSARKTMTDIFDARCALVNKEGVCHQCSELNGWFNPKQDQQAALMEVELVKASKKYDREALFQLRVALIKHIDPLTSEGNELQEVLLSCNRMAMGEEEIPST